MSDKGDSSHWAPSQAGPFATTPTLEEKQHALKQALQSRTFARSDQLRAFLRYVCSMEMDGKGDQITEYRIAVEALGRRSDYTGGEDSTVRSRAYALRSKLEELYSHELPEAVTRIEFLKGSYCPRFVVQTAAVAGHAPAIVLNLGRAKYDRATATG